MGRLFTILVVDDDTAVRDVVVEILSVSGFGVLTAGSGQEALRILAERPVDLLFTDITMASMDGAELARQARQLRPGLKVLFSTGGAQKTTEPNAIHEARFLFKPFRTAELLREVEALLGA